MSRTCMKCGIKGHNSRSCSSIKDYYWSTHTKQLQLDNTNNKPTIELERRSTSTSLKLFGVHLLDHHHDHDLSSSNSSSISVARKRKAPIASMASPHLTSSTVSGYQASPYTAGIYRNDLHGLHETKHMIKRVEWSEEEHRRFLEGIEKLGKGDWRGISRHYVTTRSPIQIASHSQNYFLRLQNTTTTSDNSMMNNQDCDSDPSKQVCRRRRPKLFYGRPRDINIYKPNGTEASVDRRPDGQHSRPLPINVNSSFQSASAAAEGLDLDLKLAAS